MALGAKEKRGAKKLTEPLKKNKFKVGKSANPKGRKPLTKEEKEIRKVSKDELKNIIAKYLMYDVKDLHKLILKGAATPKSVNSKTKAGITVLEYSVASVMVNAIKNGNETKIEWFLEKLHGKELQRVKIDHTNSDGRLAKLDIPKIGAEAAKKAYMILKDEVRKIKSEK